MTIPQYKYKRLSPGSTRLLRILPAHPDKLPGNAPIRCQLFECPLLSADKTRPYEALSYVWGPQSSNPQFITLVENDNDNDSDNGEERHCRFPVGESLHAALKALRDPFIERVVWIDAICINQGDNDEKSEQVGFMARIYARAGGGVIIWLGEDDDEGRAGRGLDVIEWFANTSEEEEGWETESQFGLRNKDENPVVELLGGEDRKAVVELLGRAWFKRIWVLQEAAAARHVVVKCGEKEISGHAFSTGLERVMEQLRSWYQRGGFRDGSYGEEEREVNGDEILDDEEEFGDEEKMGNEEEEEVEEEYKDGDEEEEEEEEEEEIANGGAGGGGVDDEQVVNNQGSAGAEEKADDEESNIDGTVGSYASETVSDTQDWDLRDLEKLIQSTIHLIQGAGLRPRREKSTSSRYYLRLSPLCRLVNMYQHREATYRPDKIFALLGMSSDDPGAAGFLPDYGIPWEEVIRRFVRCILGSDRVLVTGWDDSDIVVMRGKGCVLGTVMQGQKRRREQDDAGGSLAIDWIEHAWLGLSDNPLELYTSIDDVREGDVLYLPQGASVPLIIRAFRDYAVVVRIVDRMPGHMKPVPDGFEWPDNCLVLWDWGLATYSHPERFMDSRAPGSIKTELEGDLSKAIRLVQTLLLKCPPSITEGWWSRQHLGNEIDHYVTVGPNEPEMELLGICDRILPPVDNSSAEDYELLWKLLAKPSSHEIHWPIYRSPLWLAASTGRRDVVERILDVSKATGFWELRLAAARTDEAVVNLLLDTGKVDLMMEDEEGKTAAFYAMAKYQPDKDGSSSWLYNHERVANYWCYSNDRDAQSRIFHRFMATNKTVGEVVLQKGLEYEIMKGETIVSLAEQYELDLGIKNKHGQTLLMLAARYGNEYLVRHLLASGHGSLSDRDHEGRTPVMLACLGLNRKMVSLLADAGQSSLNINARDNKGETAVVIAAGRNTDTYSRLIVNDLINRGGTDLDARDESGRTLLMLAASRGWGDTVKDLVQNHRVDLNAVDLEGRTALMHAIKRSAYQEDSAMAALDFLLRHEEVDVEIRDVNGESALTLMQEVIKEERRYKYRIINEYTIETDTTQEDTTEHEDLDTRKRLFRYMKPMWALHKDYMDTLSLYI